MSVNRLVQALLREFLPDLSAGFLNDCLDWNVHLTSVEVTEARKPPATAGRDESFPAR